MQERKYRVEYTQKFPDREISSYTGGAYFDTYEEAKVFYDNIEKEKETTFVHLIEVRVLWSKGVEDDKD